MIFPVKGGRFNGVNKKLRKHEETPIPSSERIFIRPCRTADGKTTFTTTPKPAQIMYTVGIYLEPEYLGVNSIQFQFKNVLFQSLLSHKLL